MPFTSSKVRRVPHPNPASPARQLTLTFLRSSVPIPLSLSLEHVLSDSLCHPLSLSDFNAFLAREERAQENLAFVLWFREYERRFLDLPEEWRGKAEMIEPSEEWERHMRRKAEDRREKESERSLSVSVYAPTPLPEGEAPWEEIDLGALEAGREEVVFLGERAMDNMPDAETLAIAPWIAEEGEEKDRQRMREIIQGAEEELEKTVQLLLRDDLPLREEIVRVVLHFLTLSSPHALSSAHIPALLLTLRRTTHPHSFRQLYAELLSYLQLDAHPRFIRAALVNTRAPFRAAMWCIALGLYLGGGLAIGLALVFCQQGELNRAWRLTSLPLVWAGISSSLCLWNGICPLAFSTRSRQLALWEPMPMPADSGHRRTRGRPHPGFMEFVRDDWWAGHPEAREMQWAVMIAAGRWGVLGMLIWAGVVLALPTGR
ncbi:hypothetical protein DACRYDRAFT_94427 [Dacryopinax primogenitus]|uniref:RGS domain-containing protein n=1 Tax=Dacryopinax primogenitus (strain DJM 731) TaxID=1858805 RepID=M5G1T1_DACPD|nr:uncharacterized protein DACRYDRAFT_94427 [Dacryopinax primogenitus]EJU02664.1 hypothetical protein DACRYDRAFT_94427 [Dacryopinax primogenitus]